MQGSTVDTDVIQVDSAQSHGHGEHPDLRLFGFILFLISESMLFVGLFVAYGAFRVVAESWPPAGTPELERLLPGINTVILLSSSFVIHQADLSIKKGDVPGVRKWFGLTMLMGAIFLAGQVYEYQHLEFGLTSHLFGSTFFVLTGFHGLHVLIGVILMGTVIVRSLKEGHYSEEKHFGVEAAEVYWHFVDVIWIILFTLLYLL